MSTVNCPSYQCADLEPYPGAEDCTTYKGGASSMVLFKCGLSVDISNGAAVQAAIDAGDAIKYSNLTIAWEPPSPLSTPSLVACTPDIVANYDHTVNITDRNVVAGSVDHYNSVSSSTGWTFGAALIYECDAARVSYISTSPITMEGGRQMPGQNDALQSFVLQMKFRSELASLPIMATPPAGIFD